MFGVENLKKLVVSVAEALNIVVKVLKGNFLALFGLAQVLLSLKAVDFAAVLKELGDLQPAERADVEAAFTGALDLGNPDLQAKVVAGVGYLEEAVGVVGEAVNLGTKAYDLVLRVKKFLGV